MLRLIKKHPNITTFLIFAAFSIWWVILQFTSSPNDNVREWFSGTYGVMSLFGALAGWQVAKRWGGYKSYVGRAILMFAFGLLAQEFGQITYSLYTLLFHIEVPYPSVGDVGYFGSIFFYIYGTWLLGKAVGANISLKSYGNKLQAIIIPLAILAGSYTFFLRSYTADWSHPLTALLDFGYPLGQAFYLSLGILVLILSRKYLGGIMRPVILFLLFGLILQYAADFTFLYKSNNGTWTTGGLNDYQYLIAYFVMTLALIRFRDVMKRITG